MAMPTPKEFIARHAYYISEEDAKRLAKALTAREAAIRAEEREAALWECYKIVDGHDAPIARKMIKALLEQPARDAIRARASSSAKSQPEAAKEAAHGYGASGLVAPEDM